MPIPRPAKTSLKKCEGRHCIGVTETLTHGLCMGCLMHRLLNEPDHAIVCRALKAAARELFRPAPVPLQPIAKDRSDARKSS